MLFINSIAAAGVSSAILSGTMNVLWILTSPPSMRVLHRMTSSFSSAPSYESCTLDEIYQYSFLAHDNRAARSDWIKWWPVPSHRHYKGSIVGVLRSAPSLLLRSNEAASTVNCRQGWCSPGPSKSNSPLCSTTLLSMAAYTRSTCGCRAIGSIDRSWPVAHEKYAKCIHRSCEGAAWKIDNRFILFRFLEKCKLTRINKLQELTKFLFVAVIVVQASLSHPSAWYVRKIGEKAGKVETRRRGGR